MTAKAREMLDRTGAKKLLSGVRRWARQMNPNGYLLIEEIPNRRGDDRKQCAGAICVIEITANNAPGKSLPASVLNVSKRGLCVLVDEPLAKGSLVMLDLSGRTAAGGRSLLAHVTRIQRASGHNGYVLGLKRHSDAA